MFGLSSHKASGGRRRRGFTLIELLVVISIIALLIAILLPALASVKRTTQVTLCSSNLKQYALGLTTYATDEPDNKYPTHVFWSPIVIWTGTTSSSYGPAHQWLDMFIDLIAAGNPEIFWCPLDCDLRSTPCSPHYDGVIDPRYGNFFTFLSGHSGGLYWTDYMRMANHEGGGSGTTIWGPTGNSTDDGPPTGPNMPKDVILADAHLSDGGYIDNHAENPRDYRTHRENNSAYSDGHVETHHHHFNVGAPGTYYYWDAHYYRTQAGEMWLW